MVKPKVKISRKRCTACGSILWQGRCLNHKCKTTRRAYDEENE